MISLDSIEFSLNHELPQFTYGKTEKTLEKLKQYILKQCEKYVLDNEDNKSVHTINIISTNNSLAETIQWKVRTHTKFNEIQDINVFVMSSKRGADFNNLDALLGYIWRNPNDLPNIIIMCCHAKRIKEDCIELMKGSKNFVPRLNFNYDFDEPDANLGVIKKFLDKIVSNKLVSCINKMQFITATPFERFWKMLNQCGINELKNKDTISEIRYEELLENYRQFTSHNIVTLDNTTDNPLEYIINCIEQKLINLYKRIIVFAPGHLYTKKEGVGSHLEITNYFNNIDFCVLVHNGTFKGFVFPDKTKISIIDFNSMHSIHGELRDTLRKWNEVYPTMSLAITGYWTIERGITFNTDGFNFTHMILSSYHGDKNKINKLIQLMGRGSGHKDFADKITVICPSEIKSTIESTVERLINLKRSNPEVYNYNDFSTKSKKGAIPVKVTFNDDFVRQSILLHKKKADRIHAELIMGIEDGDIEIKDYNNSNKFNIHDRTLKTMRVYTETTEKKKKNRRFKQFTNAFNERRGVGQSGTINNYSFDIAQDEFNEGGFINPVSIGWITYRI
uniref:Uncharacterized protein n=1 Tax=viral metagenome TaxID=1070528 RepID=A0A6C0B5S7_9ZZZZ